MKTVQMSKTLDTEHEKQQASFKFQQYDKGIRSINISFLGTY